MSKHKHYELLNLVGYGLAKFDDSFWRRFGRKSKMDFYRHLVELGVAETTGTVKNRQDLFDPFFPNPRQGWKQRADDYEHRKLYIDSLYGELENDQFADMVRDLLSEFGAVGAVAAAGRRVPPIEDSKFKKMMETGYQSEHYFMNNFSQVEKFSGGTLKDARFLGDGYDFQIALPGDFFLAEVKGVRGRHGGVRLTDNEHCKAKEFKSQYGLVVVSNLDDIPKITAVFDPVAKLQMTMRETVSRQREHHVAAVDW